MYLIFFRRQWRLAFFSTSPLFAAFQHPLCAPEILSLNICPFSRDSWIDLCPPHLTLICKTCTEQSTRGSTWIIGHSAKTTDSIISWTGELCSEREVSEARIKLDSITWKVHLRVITKIGGNDSFPRRRVPTNKRHFLSTNVCHH